MCLTNLSGDTMKEYVREYEMNKKVAEYKARFRKKAAVVKKELGPTGSRLSRVGAAIWSEAKRGAKYYHDHQQPKAKLSREKAKLSAAKVEYQRYKINKQLQDLKSKRRY